MRAAGLETEAQSVTSSPPKSMSASDTTKPETVVTKMGGVQSWLQAQEDYARGKSSYEERLERKRLRSSSKPVEAKHHEDEDTKSKEIIAGLEEVLSRREDDLEKQQHAYDELEDKHRKLHKDVDKLTETQRELRKGSLQLKEKLTKEERVNKGWDSAIAEIVRHFAEPYAQEKSIGVDPWCLSDLRIVIEHMFHGAMQTSQLQDRIQILQKELLSKADKVQAAPDGQLAQDFRAIVSSIKTLCRTAHAAGPTDPTAALGDDFMLKNVSLHHWNDRRKKNLLIEAWVWSVLIKFVFNSPFAIFGKLCSELTMTWRHLFSDNHVGEWPEPSMLCETWRCTTMKRMMNLLDGAVITMGELQGKDPNLESSIAEARQHVKAEIEDGFAKLSGIPDLARAQSVIDKAFTLAMKMSLQRYRLQVTFPSVGDVFNMEEMDAVLQTDEGEVLEGTVAFAANPGLTKWGDTHGERFDQRYDVVPALVHVNPTAGITGEGLDKAFPDHDQYSFDIRDIV